MRKRQNLAKARNPNRLRKQHTSVGGSFVNPTQELLRRGASPAGFPPRLKIAYLQECSSGFCLFYFVCCAHERLRARNFALITPMNIALPPALPGCELPQRPKQPGCGRKRRK
jgi:hypothetical protein